MTVFYQTLLSIFVGCASRLTHWMGGALYIWTNGIAQRGAKTKHHPHSVVNQFKRFLYNHTATTRLRAEIILLWGIYKKKKEKKKKKLASPFSCLAPRPLTDVYWTLLFSASFLSISLSLFSLQAIHLSYLTGWHNKRGQKSECLPTAAIYYEVSHTQHISHFKLQTRLYSTYIPVNIKMANKK